MNANMTNALNSAFCAGVGGLFSFSFFVEKNINLLHKILYIISKIQKNITEYWKLYFARKLVGLNIIKLKFFAFNNDAKINLKKNIGWCEKSAICSSLSITSQDDLDSWP